MIKIIINKSRSSNATTSHIISIILRSTMSPQRAKFLLIKLLLCILFFDSLVKTTEALSSGSILQLVKRYSNGPSVSQEIAASVKEFIQSNLYSESKPPLEDPLLYGNYEVTYVGQGSAQKGNPAGGRFRGRLGQLIYQNEGLYQHILPPATTATSTSTPSGPMVVNYIKGKLLNCIPLAVLLVGYASALSRDEIAKLNDRVSPEALKLSMNGVVQANFRPPILSIGTGTLQLTLQSGPPSSVVLDTPFVDPFLRTGVGSRGSLFLFRRIVDSDELRRSEGWREVVSRAPLSTKSIGKLVIAAGTVLGARSLLLVKKVSKELALPCMLLALGLGIWTSPGGIIDDSPPLAQNGGASRAV